MRQGGLSVTISGSGERSRLRDPAAHRAGTPARSNHQAMLCAHPRAQRSRGLHSLRDEATRSRGESVGARAIAIVPLSAVPVAVKDNIDVKDFPPRPPAGIFVRACERRDLRAAPEGRRRHHHRRPTRSARDPTVGVRSPYGTPRTCSIRR